MGRTIFIAVCLLAFTASACLGSEQMPLSESISIKADSLQQDKGNSRYVASGKVIITWSGMELTAEQAVYDTESKTLEAEGNVVMMKGDDILTGKKFTVNVETGRTELDHGSLEVRKGNIHFTGEKIIRVDDRSLQLTKSELTTCDLPGPSWKFGAEKLEVNLLGYATGRHIIFYVKDVPVLYLPWIAFPVVRDRKSGILFPRFGYSSSRGAQIILPAYWVIAPNQDLQLDLDLQTKRGIGTGLQYRYARKRGSEGTVGGYLIYDLRETFWRGQVAQKHTEIFSGSMNLRSTLNVTSDRTFLSDFGEKSGDYNRQSNESSIIFLKTWQNFALTSMARYSDDLYTDSNRNTLQKLPEIGVAAVRLPVFKTPVFFDFDSTIANLYRETGVRGQRLTAFPRLILPAKLPGGINASVFAGLQIRASMTSRDPAHAVKNSTDGYLLPAAGARVSVPLQRVYTLQAGSLDKLRHEMIPEISYRFTAKHATERQPLFDFDDHPVSQSTVSWSLTNRFGGRFRQGDTTEYRDLLRLTLSQGYTFSGSRRNLLTMVDDNRNLDDLSLESEAWLNKNVILTFDSRYNLRDNRITSAAPGLELDTKKGTIFGASYRLARHEVEYGEMRISTRIINPWVLGYTSRYSFDRSGFLESVYTAEYIQKCWSVTFVFRDRPGNKTGTVNFNLAGLTGN